MFLTRRIETRDHETKTQREEQIEAIQYQKDLEAVSASSYRNLGRCSSVRGSHPAHQPSGNHTTNTADDCLCSVLE